MLPTSPKSHALPRGNSKLPLLIPYLSTWHHWYWLFIPFLALAAYLSVARIGFLADDFFQLHQGMERGVDPLETLSKWDGGFLRPVGVLITFQLGWAFFGYDPLPYHLVALFAHAATSLILGLWLATLSRKPPLGWLAGSLFAVFPLHIEAVGWVGAQFDTFATLFVLASLCSFTLWWSKPTAARKHRWTLYSLALALFTLAVFTKESVFTFIPILVISAVIARPPARWPQWRPLLLASAPFLIPIALNIAFRYVKIGSIGGYGIAADLPMIVWDAISTYLRLLLAPINEAVVGNASVQITGLLTMLTLLVALALFGRNQRSLLLLAAAWMLLTMIPILNIASGSDDLQQRMLPVTLLNVPDGTDNLQQNRYLYLVSVGYLVGVATLLYSAIAAARRAWKTFSVASVGTLLLLSVALCWVNLRPWHTATLQVNELVSHLLRAIPPAPRPDGMTWYSDRVPFKYKGVPLLLSGLGISRVFAGGDYPNVERVVDATQAPLAENPADAFALRFSYDETSERFGLDYLAGITNESAPPVAESSGKMIVWDFRACDEAPLDEWVIAGATLRCEQGKGLVITGADADPQLIGDTIDLGADLYTSKFIRIRVSAKYPAITDNTQPISDWFWKWGDVDFSGERIYTLPAKRDGEAHVYWTFVPSAMVPQPAIELRYDPINSRSPSEVHWIAVDFVD